jgi:hypothetical protein
VLSSRPSGKHPDTGLDADRVINLWLPIVPALAGLPTLRRLEGAPPRRRLRLRRRAVSRT